MNQTDFKPRSPLQQFQNKLLAPNTSKGNSFSIYNPEMLSFNNTQIKLERAKDELLKLQNILILHKKELSNFKVECEISKSELVKNIQGIQSIISISEEANKGNEEKQEDFHELNKSPSPSLRPRDFYLMNLLEKRNNNLEKQIVIKDNELSELKKTDKVSRFTKLNNNCNNNTVHLAELKKNYDLLQLQCNELQYRLSKTIDERNMYQALGTRFKVQCASFFNKESSIDKLDSTTKQPFNNSQGMSAEDKSTLAELKKENDKLKKQITELNLLSRGYEEKGNTINNQIKKKDQDINSIKLIISKFERDIKKLGDGASSPQTSGDLEQVISSLKSELENIKQTYKELNDTNSKQTKQVKNDENALCDLESDLDKQKAQNMALNEIIQEGRVNIITLQDAEKESKQTISQLEKQLEQLKASQGAFFTTSIKSNISQLS